MRIIGYGIILIVIILGISFACLNAEMVKIDYYVGTMHWPLSLLLAVVLAIGSLLGVLVSLGIFLKIKHRNYQLQKRLKLAEKEIENLRTMPLKD